MKKFVTVLVLGITLMSCSKEEIPVVQVEEEVEVVVEPCASGYTVLGCGYRIGESGMPIYSIEVEDPMGVTFWVDVFKAEYDDLRLEYDLNGIACW